jgi:hypothetical protein
MKSLPQLAALEQQALKALPSERGQQVLAVCGPAALYN